MEIICLLQWIEDKGIFIDALCFYILYVCLEKEAFAQHKQRNAPHLTLPKLSGSNKLVRLDSLKASHPHISHILALETGEILHLANEGNVSLE